MDQRGQDPNVHPRSAPPRLLVVTSAIDVECSRLWMDGGQLLADSYRSLAQRGGSFFVDGCCRESLVAIYWSSSSDSKRRALQRKRGSFSLGIVSRITLSASA